MINQLFSRPLPFRMSLISRTKLAGIGRHYGVLLEYAPTWAEVLELQHDEGPRVVPLETFAANRARVTELTFDDEARIVPAWARVRDLVSKAPTYDLLNRNCEHFARHVMTGQEASTQVSTWAFLAATIGLIALLSDEA